MMNLKQSFQKCFEASLSEIATAQPRDLRVLVRDFLLDCEAEDCDSLAVSALIELCDVRGPVPTHSFIIISAVDRFLQAHLGAKSDGDKSSRLKGLSQILKSDFATKTAFLEWIRTWYG